MRIAGNPRQQRLFRCRVKNLHGNFWLIPYLYEGGMSETESKARILVVDDDSEIRELTRLVLTGSGYDVDLATHGSEALDRIAVMPYDLVLLDINMPGMDGWETLRLIRADVDLDHMPVVMFSVKGQVVDKMQAMQEGAVDYIPKPFEVDVLASRVGRVLEGQA